MLRSGRTSTYYLDKYLFSTRPEILGELARLFSDEIRRIRERHAVDRLAGAELGGIPLVTAASLATGIPSVLVRNQRKNYGTSKQVEGTLNRGERVVLIEDVATTGGQSVEAVRTLEELGAKVIAVIVTIDRQEGAREAIEATGAAFIPIFTRADLGIDASPDR